MTKEEILKEFDEIATKLFLGFISDAEGDEMNLYLCNDDEACDEIKKFISESIDKALTARDEEWERKLYYLQIDFAKAHNEHYKVIDDLINSIK